MNNLRVTAFKEEILTNLESIKQNNESIFLWQEIDNNKTTKECTIIEIDSVKNLLTLSLKNKIDLSNIDKQHTIYFRGDQESILFKCSLKEIRNNFLILDIPISIRIMDKKINSRLILDDSELNIVVLEKSDNITSLPRKFALQLLDITQDGFTLKVSRQYQMFFNVGDRCKLISILEHKLVEDINLTVEYITKSNQIKNSNTKKWYKVGIQTDRPLPSDIFDQII